jgi:hypothetical protein
LAEVEFIAVDVDVDDRTIQVGGQLFDPVHHPHTSRSPATIDRSHRTIVVGDGRKAR